MKDLYLNELYAFMARAFEILEPSQVFEWNWHIDCIAEHLTASYNGELPKLIINMPPRCLKSVSVAQIYPAWCFAKKASHQFIGASYAHSLAERNVMATRRILQSDWYLANFPDVEISKDQNQKDYFTTTQNGQYKGTGIDGTITGFGCETLLIDDPISPNEGNSPTIRNSTNQAIRNTLFSRFNDKRNEKTIMIMQRVHDDDPTGNLARDLSWHILKLPAETKTHVSISLGDRKWEMLAGELLTPRLPREALDALRLDLQDAGYAGQYLQEPIPVGGGEFKHEWYQHFDNKLTRKYGNIYILCDAAGGDELQKKKKKTSDWTAFMVVEAGVDNNYYLVDAVRDRLNPTERIDTLFMLHKKWNSLTGHPPKVGYEKYGMMTDTHYLRKKMNEENYRFPIIELGGRTMKEERIRRLIPDLQKMRWYFPHELIYYDNDGRKFDLVKELIEGEFATFPKARFDDMSDALARIYEPEMGVVFPKAIKKSYFSVQNEPTSWLDY